MRAPMPIIVGAPRSGTTLLRFMLDSHPEVAIPPETGFLVIDPTLSAEPEVLRSSFLEWVTGYPPDAPTWADFGIPAERLGQALLDLEPFRVADGFRLFYRMYAERFGKPRYGDKTPLYCRHLPEVRHLLPEAHFIHLVRDGRDVAHSLRHLWFSEGDDMAALARQWVRDVSMARTEGASCPHYLEVRYETLVQRPAEVLTDICEFLQLRYDPAMLAYHQRTPKRLKEFGSRMRRDGSLLIDRAQRVRQQAMTMRPPDPGRIGAGQRALSGEETRQFCEIAGDLLQTLGYPDADSRAHSS